MGEKGPVCMGAGSSFSHFQRNDVNDMNNSNCFHKPFLPLKNKAAPFEGNGYL